MLFYDNFERICRERGTSPSGACVAIGKNKTTAGNWKLSFDGPGTWDEVDLDGIRGLIENETPGNRSSTGVCVSQRWWSRVDPARTPSWVLLGSGL